MAHIVACVGGGILMSSIAVVHPYFAGTEHVGFSATRQTSRAPSAKRREVCGESHAR